MDTIPIFIPLAEAATENNISQEELTQYIQSGIISAVRLTNGELLVSKKLPKTKEQIINNKYKQLKEQPITIAEASKKYNLKKRTIQRWVKKGYIKTFHKGGRGCRMILNKAEVAYCAEIHHSRNGNSGAPLLDKVGRPYKLKTIRN